MNWPLYRNSSLDPNVPWVLVDPIKVVWNQTMPRWSHVTPKNADIEFFRFGLPTGC